MTNHYEIEALKARLMQAEGELTAMRAERTKIDIKAEVEKRGGSDHDAIARRLDKYVRTLEDGTRVAVDDAGEFRFGTGRGSYMEIPEYLDELSRAEPDLFAGKGKDAPKSSHMGPNPFAKGSLNVTQQMILYREQPDLAEHLEYLASVGKN